MAHLEEELRSKNKQVYLEARAQAVREGISASDWVLDAILRKLDAMEKNKANYYANKEPLPMPDVPQAQIHNAAGLEVPQAQIHNAAGPEIAEP